MNDPQKPFRLAIVAGEESGDLLGADLVAALKRRLGDRIELIGVGGRHLQAEGLKSLFDPSEIALMGLSAVLRDLPNLARRISQTTRAIVEAKPDCLVTIDSPDFSLRVARRVRTAAPAVATVHYVCPSVWAWRPGRAPALKPYIDHILCLLPFEPEALRRLAGPQGTFVGHRLTREAGLVAASAAQQARLPPAPGGVRTLLLLPGSRRGEVSRMIEPFRQTVDILVERGARLRLILPTVPHVEKLVRDATAAWATRPEIITDVEGKWRAFAEADAALCASGTVSLELALARVPLVATYKLDRIARMLRFMITTWSASLPNLIADRVVVPELYDAAVQPGQMARNIEALLVDSPMRRWQREGFDEVWRRLGTERPSGEIAADVVLAAAGKRR